MKASRISHTHRPLERRTFRFKNPAMRFFCPLCRTERALLSRPHLNLKNYFQVLIISVILMALTWGFMGARSLFLFFPVWISFEIGFRLNFRKEVPCPHCGFDAGWYQKDVKVARQLVKEFWQQKEGSQPTEASQEAVEEVPEMAPEAYPQTPERDNSAFFN